MGIWRWRRLAVEGGRECIWRPTLGLPPRLDLLVSLYSVYFNFLLGKSSLGLFSPHSLHSKSESGWLWGPLSPTSPSFDPSPSLALGIRLSPSPFVRLQRTLDVSPICRLGKSSCDVPSRWWRNKGKNRVTYPPTHRELFSCFFLSRR